MSPRVLTAWWDRRSDPARIELYTRWTFHFFALLEVVGIGSRLAVADAPPPVRAGLGDPQEHQGLVESGHGRRV